MNISTMKTGRRIHLTVLVCLSLILPAAGLQAQTAPSPQPAEWQRHNLLIQFHKLPKRYTCDELWYKFRDILLQLGAAPNMDILPDRCNSSAGDAAYSPRVRFDFYTPKILTGAAVSYAAINASLHDVRIAPGEPKSIDESDCALLRQLKKALPGKVVESSLTCSAPQQKGKGEAPPFDLVVRTLVPTEATTLHAKTESEAH